MKRRDFLKTVAVTMPAIGGLKADAAEPQPQGAASTADWLARWEKNILGDTRSRYCDREMGEELGWLVSPFLSGFYIAQWLIAMHDAIGKPVYRERARKWFQLMRSRMKTREDGKYFVWNYWDPAGPWDYKPDGSPKHWIGVHPNGGYYGIDVEAIVTAFEHGLVFAKADIDRLIATNRDFMWNQQVARARFQRIDGGPPDERWRNSPGVLWTALVPHDETLRRVFIANHNPSGWGGLSTTPWFFVRQGTPIVDREGATR